MVTLVCHPQGIAGSDGLPGDKGELVSMSEPLLPPEGHLSVWVRTVLWMRYLRRADKVRIAQALPSH